MAPNPMPPWIKLRDYIRSTYKFEITNTTTQTSIPPGTPIELTEIADKGLSLRVPTLCCALGHILLIRITKIQKPVELEVTVTAKVTEREPFTVEDSTISVQFYQYNENHWQAFLDACSRRQVEIDTIVKSIKE